MAVYIVRAGDTQLVKIGVAENVSRRIAEMQTVSPEPLEIIRQFVGARKEEQGLHDRFGFLRVRGEWFRFDDSMMGDVGLTDLAIEPLRRSYPLRGLMMPVDRATKYVGGRDAFMKRFAICRRSYFNWRTNGIPIERLREVSQVTAIPAKELRPDIWAIFSGDALDLPEESKAA